MGLNSLLVCSISLSPWTVFLWLINERVLFDIYHWTDEILIVKYSSFLWTSQGNWHRTNMEESTERWCFRSIFSLPYCLMSLILMGWLIQLLFLSLNVQGLGRYTRHCYERVEGFHSTFGHFSLCLVHIPTVSGRTISMQISVPYFSCQRVATDIAYTKAHALLMSKNRNLLPSYHSLFSLYIAPCNTHRLTWDVCLRLVNRVWKQPCDEHLSKCLIYLSLWKYKWQSLTTITFFSYQELIMP